jgi:hypothetical protein
MRDDVPARTPRRPPSEVEWEDLLLRVELMLRAVRITLEDVGDGDGPAGDVLRELVARERFVGEFLERAAGLGGEAGDPGGETGPEERGDALLARFLRLRTRNFAMVQRRGLGVWDWVGDDESGHEVTVYQLLTGLAAEDVAALARLRARQGKAGAC